MHPPTGSSGTRGPPKRQGGVTLPIQHCSGQALPPRGADRRLERGCRAGELQPNLLPLADRVLARTTAAEPADPDVVFLGLPHGKSAAVIAELPESTVITDCGADF